VHAQCICENKHLCCASVGCGWLFAGRGGAKEGALEASQQGRAEGYICVDLLNSEEVGKVAKKGEGWQIRGVCTVCHTRTHACTG